MFGEHGSKQEEERGTKMRRTDTAGAGMHRGVFRGGDGGQLRVCAG